MREQSHLRVMAIAIVVAVTLTPVPAASASDNAKIRATKAAARDARAKLDDLAADLEERAEEYLAVETELDSTRQRIETTEAELLLAERDVESAEMQLNDRVQAIYRKGSIDILSVFVGVTDFRDLVTRLELLERVGRSDAVIVVNVENAREQVEATRLALENRRVEQAALLTRLGERKREVEEALAAQETYLARIDHQLEKLIAEERERQERIARERARAAAQAAQQARGGRTSDVGSLPAPHPEALAVARRFIGVTPYVWGGTTPSGFDCSGLTLYSYREIGVNLPRTSRQQYHVGSFIPPDRLDVLEPGDLVFFGRNGDPDRVHHVGIYSGDGRFVHAPQTGMKVSESSLLERISSRGDYVGAVRP